MFSLKLFNHKHVSFYDGKNRDVFYEIEKNLRRQEHQKAGKKKKTLQLTYGEHYFI